MVGLSNRSAQTFAHPISIIQSRSIKCQTCQELTDLDLNPATRIACKRMGFPRLERTRVVHHDNQYAQTMGSDFAYPTQTQYATFANVGHPVRTSILLLKSVCHEVQICP